MLQSFLMVLREGFESFLIVSIILSYLKRTGRGQLASAVVLGCAVSVIASAALGFALMQGVNQALWEGVLGLVTMLMVGTLVIHMWRVGPRMKAHLENRVESVSKGGSSSWAYVGTFFLTLVMIAREGMETALMLYQVRDEGVLAGLFLGLAASLGVAWAWFRYGALVNVRRFFQVTGVFLLLFIVQVGFNSFHEFSEAGLLPSSETIHEATEPFTPYGRYGQWFSLVMVSVCIFWLVVTQIQDKLRGGPSVRYQNAE